MVHSSVNRPATASEVISIIGQQDDVVIARIVATGATPQEVTEAFTWINADDYMGADAQRSNQGRVAEVYRVLDEQLGDIDDRS